MKPFWEYSKEMRNKLLKDKESLCKTALINNDMELRFYNEEGTRCFWAQRKSNPLTRTDFWYVSYGLVSLIEDSEGNPLWYQNRAALYRKAGNGTEIPFKVDTREQALELARQIGKLVM